MLARTRDLKLVLDAVTAGPAAKNDRELRMEASNRAWVCEQGVQGLGIGPKVTDGQETGELALRVYVGKKRPLKEMENPAPREVIDEAMGPVRTDVIEIGEVQAELFAGSVTPIVSGCGVGNVVDRNVGTLGAVVRRRSDGLLGLLSNAHVLARDGLGAPGEPISQPSPIDGGHSVTDVVASLADFVPFEFTDVGYPNVVDAAVAMIESPRGSEPAIRLIGHPPTGLNHNLRRGMRVHKVGRTSDLTEGVIQDVNFRVHFPLRSAPTQKHRVGFRDQVMCTRYTEPGDSGALVMSSSGRAIGLHFAGSHSTSIFNRIRPVLESLEIDLLIEETT